MDPVEKVVHNGRVLAIVIRREYDKKGLEFFSHEDSPLQIGVHIRDKGTLIPPHRHKPIEKIENLQTQEAFHVTYGKIQVDLYERELVKRLILESGDAILLLSGGHSVSFLENSKMIEIKQGPYRGVNEEKEFL